eukprot:5883571-Amphidinium_carterae.1
MICLASPATANGNSIGRDALVKRLFLGLEQQLIWLDAFSSVNLCLSFVARRQDLPCSKWRLS